MREFTDFDNIYVFINKYAVSIQFPYEIGGYGNVDFFLNMKDGSSYAFTAFTVIEVNKIMISEGVSHFVIPGMIIVKDISYESIFSAIEECIRLSYTGNCSLAHFGVIQGKYSGR